MPIIERVSNKPYRWRIAVAKSLRHANKEKMMPARFHHVRRVPHHFQVPRLSLAADPGRGAPALQERVA